MISWTCKKLGLSEVCNNSYQIRLSERFFYQKIKDIYATSIDYNLKDEKTIQFFKVVQNKPALGHQPANRR